MHNLFMKTFDPLIMNGFKNKKELESYWLYSQIGSAFMGFGILSYLMHHIFSLDLAHTDILIVGIVSLIYLILFASVFSLPFLINWVFVKLLPHNLPYWYVNYMWANSKNAILTVMQDLPSDVIKEEEMLKLHQNTDTNEQVKLLIKTWHKNFSKELNFRKIT